MSGDQHKKEDGKTRRAFTRAVFYGRSAYDALMGRGQHESEPPAVQTVKPYSSLLGLLKRRRPVKN